MKSGCVFDDNYIEGFNMDIKIGQLNTIRYSSVSPDMIAAKMRMAVKELPRPRSSQAAGWFDRGQGHLFLVKGHIHETGTLRNEPVIYRAGHNLADMSGILRAFALAKSQTQIHIISGNGYLAASKNESFKPDRFRTFERMIKRLHDESRAYFGAKQRNSLSFSRMEAAYCYENMDLQEFAMRLSAHITGIPEEHLLCFFGAFGMEFRLNGKKVPLGHSDFLRPDQADHWVSFGRTLTFKQYLLRTEAMQQSHIHDGYADGLSEG